MCDHLLQLAHRMASWLFLTALLHSPHGYLSDGFVFPGTRFAWISPYTSISLARLKLLFPLAVYCTRHVKKRFARDLRLIFVLESDVIVRTCREDGKAAACRTLWYFFDCIRTFSHYKCSCKEKNWPELSAKSASHELPPCFSSHVVH